MLPSNTPSSPSSVLNPTESAVMTRQFEDETPDIVKVYFNAVGITRWLPEEEFSQKLSQRFGFVATEYLEDANIKTYMTKPSVSVEADNLDLALAVRSQYVGTRYEAYLSWFAMADLPQPKRILDIGCNIGITTCFLATRHPEATIIGIDCSGEAIACAKKLAAKLNLTNVEFIEADVLALPDGLKGQNSTSSARLASQSG